VTPSSEISNPCFQDAPSVDELIRFQKGDDCTLFDYKHIFPLISQSCEYWENMYGNTSYVHFSEIFIEERQHLVCLRQDYIESPAFSF